MQHLNSTKGSIGTRVNNSIQDSPARPDFGPKEIEKVYLLCIISDQ